MQKLGIPTEIATTWLGYYDTPIEDMSHGDSIHIMPGVKKSDYGETGAIRDSGTASAAYRRFGVAHAEHLRRCAFGRDGLEEICG